MDVTAVVPVFLQREQALSLYDAAREGRVLEARVEAMLASNLARIAIAGSTLDVATPRPLPIGAMLTLRAERDGGQLRLITQGPIRGGDAPPPSAGAQTAPSTLLDPVKAVLSRIQTMAVEAALAKNPASEAPALPGAAASAPTPGRGSPPLPAAGLPPQAGAQAGILPQVPTGTPAQTANLGPLLAEQALAEAIMPGRTGTPGTALPPAQGAQPPPSSPPGPQQQSTTGPALLAQILEARPTPAQTAPLAPILAERAFAQAMLPNAAAPGLAPPPAQAKAPAPPTGLPHQGGLVPGAPPDLTAATAAGLAAEARETRPVSAALSDALAAYAASEASPAQVRADRAPVHFSIEIPLHIPGNPAPLRLEVEHDQEPDGEDEDGTPRAPSWTIRFAAEAGALGMVHAAITMVDERIGVQLWAERGQTAALFQESALQLQDALTASDLKLEALTIAEGKPTERAPARERRL